MSQTSADNGVAERGAAQVVRTLGGAVFLASSWTWVVGMVLPVYLVHDFGLAGWVAFAVPNVIGAASVGFVFARRDRLERFVGEHRTALLWFSLVTVLFHLSVMARVAVEARVMLQLPRLGAWSFGGSGAVAALVLGGVALGLAFVRGPSWKWWGILGGAAYMASLGVLAWGWEQGDVGLFNFLGEHHPVMALGAMPALVFGFLLCPQIDLTLLRVRRDLEGRAGREAFVIGFGVFFFVMIIGTLFYTGVRWVPMAVFAHLCVQSVFTMGAHLRELRAHLKRWWWPVVVAAAVLVGVASASLAVMGDYREGYALSRLGYELFISAYGLVFPAYVWIVAVWGFAPDGAEVSRRARLGVWLAALVIAGPMFWVGYIEQMYGWLVVGVGVSLAAPWVAGQLVGGGRDA